MRTRVRCKHGVRDSPWTPTRRAVARARTADVAPSRRATISHPAAHVAKDWEGPSHAVVAVRAGGSEGDPVLPDRARRRWLPARPERRERHRVGRHERKAQHVVVARPVVVARRLTGPGNGIRADRPRARDRARRAGVRAADAALLSPRTVLVLHAVFMELGPFSPGEMPGTRTFSRTRSELAGAGVCIAATRGICSSRADRQSAGGGRETCVPAS